MKPSNNCIEMIKQFEGFRNKAYYDSVGKLTIGYGHTKNVTKDMVITKEKGEELLKEDIERIATPSVNLYHEIYNFNQNQYDALCSFAFNVGSIHGLTQKGTRTKEKIGEMILAYKFAGGKPILLERRKKEQELYLKEMFINEPIYEFTKGRYRLTSNLKVRNGVGIDKRQKTYSELTKNAQKFATKNGILLSGTIVDVSNIYLDTNKNIWGKIPSGYIALVFNGNQYVSRET